MNGRLFSYLSTAENILRSYTAGIPLSVHLAGYFSRHKKHGSKDRRLIRHLCYCYFRLGGMAGSLEIQQRLVAGYFLCTNLPDELAGILPLPLLESLHMDTGEKMPLLSSHYATPFSWEDMFPFDHFSRGLDAARFARSIFVQPRLFLRTRPGCRERVIGKLVSAGIEFAEVEEGKISLPPATRVEEIIHLNSEVVVQDLNSARVSVLFPPLEDHRIWDCCAASGGKSILAADHYGRIDLTVTDIRNSILRNLHHRFSEAGMENFRVKQADLRYPQQAPPGPFDLVIADLPCTGSGTWSRTPEEIQAYRKGRADAFADLQRQILVSVIPSLRPGGYLLYITCSAFATENEDNIAWLEEHQSLRIQRLQLFEGYDEQADTMFACLLQKI